MNLQSRVEAAKRKHGVYFIAELGQNHQGRLKIACQMVDSLVGSGVSAVKTAKRDINLSRETWENQPYDNKNSFGSNYFEHRKALELSKKDFISLKNYAESKGFDFISSFTDANSLDFLCEIGVKTLKIASSRITDIELLKKTAATGKDIILSSGMSTHFDIERAIEIFVKNELFLLQCTASYPTCDKDLNLNVLTTFQELYSNVVNGFGFSGHHTGIAPDLAAYMLGADIIERHYTLNRAWKGTDHAASLGLEGIKYILKYISQIKNAMGSPEKFVCECEKPALKKLRA